MELSAQDRFLIFWSALGAVTFLTIWNLPWRFQVNDDVIMMWLVSGAYTGKPESYAVFIHPILSWGFSKLYHIYPEFPWYGAVWYAILAISCFLALLRTSELDGTINLKAFLAVFILTISIHFCMFPQFTLVAGFAGFAAFSVLFSRLRRGRIWYYSIGLLLFTFGVMIRWESVALVGLGYFLYLSLNKDSSFFRIATVRGFVLGIVFTFLVGGKWYWEKNSSYSDYLEFNKVRSGVIDHPIFRQQILDKQIEENSVFFFFSRWFFEGDRPTKEELILKKNELDSQFLSWNQVANSFERVVEFQKVEVFKSFLIAGILTLFFFAMGPSKRLFLFFLAWILFFLVFNHFYLIQGRVIFLFFLCLLYPVLDGFLPDFPDWVLKMGKVICLLALLVHGNNFLKEARGREVMNSEFTELKSSLESGMPLIFEGYQEHNLIATYTAEEPVPFISTGWISRSVFQQKALERLGIIGFDRLQRFALITPSINNEILFPVYMNHTFGNFQLLDSVQTENFILLQFEKR